MLILLLLSAPACVSAVTTVLSYRYNFVMFVKHLVEFGVLSNYYLLCLRRKNFKGK